jgi:hypothetical protein
MVRERGGCGVGVGVDAWAEEGVAATNKVMMTVARAMNFMMFRVGVRA